MVELISSTLTWWLPLYFERGGRVLCHLLSNNLVLLERNLTQWKLIWHSVLSSNKTREENVSSSSNKIREEHNQHMRTVFVIISYISMCKEWRMIHWMSDLSMKSHSTAASTDHVSSSPLATHQMWREATITTHSYRLRFTRCWVETWED